MIKKAFVLLFVNLIASVCLYAQVFKNAQLTITQLEDAMWVVETSDHTTMYIIEGSEKAVLIDTGTDCASLDSIVRLITNKPLYVVITHMHPDHAGNVRYFNEIWLHPADTVLLGKMGVHYEGVIHYVRDNDVFELGDRTLEVKHMPGHTPGSIVLLDYQSGNCYSGDAFGSGQVWMQLEPHVSMKVYAASCRKLEILMDEEITKIYCGHYPYVKKAYDKSYMTDMRTLAEKLSEGTAPKGEPYPIKTPVGSQNPMITTLGSAMIVYDPENIN